MDKRTRADIGNVHKSTMAIAEIVLEHLEDIGRPLPDHPAKGYPAMWGMGKSSEHATGFALDFMVTADTSIGDDIVEFVIENEDEFGLRWVIWEQEIYSTEIAPGTWRPMEDRGSATENHMDHPHILFDGRFVNGPATDDVLTPPRFPLPRGWYFGPASGPDSSVSGWYSHREDLRTWQARMAARGWTITADGRYGTQTGRVARQFQTEKGLAVDALIGRVTWDAAWTEDVT